MTERAFNARELVLVPVVAVVGAFLVLDAPPLGLPLSAVFLGQLVLGGARIVTVVAVLTGAVAAGAFGVWKAVAVGFVLVTVAWGAQALMRRDPWKVGTVITVVTYAGYLLTAAVSYASIGLTLFEGVSRDLETVTSLLGGDVTGTADLLVRTWPSSMLLIVALGSALCVRVLARIGVLLEVDVRSPARLAELDLDWNVVWLVIAGLGGAVSIRLFGLEAWTVETIALNVGFFGLGLLAAQGLGVAEAIFRRLGLGWLLRLFAYGLLLIVGALGPVLVIVGFADFWVNLRRLPRDGSPPDEAVREDSEAGVE